MISFRFHLISITAIFLGIAIGVIVGSTFVDRAIVDGLRGRIDTVSENLDQRREEAERLQSALDRMRAATDANAAYAVTDRLAEEYVLVIAGRGADESAIDGVVQLAQQAGGTVPGVVWVESALADLDPAALDELADVAGVAGGEPDAVREALWSALADELTGADGDAGTGDPGGTTTTSAPVGPTDEPDEPETDVLGATMDSPFLRFEPSAEGAVPTDLAGQAPLVLVVTGPELDDGVAGTLVPVVEQLAAADLAVAVAEAFREPDADAVDPPARGAAATAARPEALATSVSTVDHLDVVEGWVAAVLVLADARDGIIGTYGYGEGTSGPSPAWRPLG